VKMVMCIQFASKACLGNFCMTSSGAGTGRCELEFSISCVIISSSANFFVNESSSSGRESDHANLLD
jgi:hypothetical protein